MGGRDATQGALCIYCSRALENSVGGSEVGHLWATITCAHGEFVYAACMLDRAERFACGHIDPQSCVWCRSEWPARSRPPHPAELAKDLPRSRPGRGWSAVKDALQFTELFEEHGPRLVPASYVTAGSHPTFDHMVRTHGRSPTSSFLLCFLFIDALGLPQLAHVPQFSPHKRIGSGHRPLLRAFRRVRHLTTGRLAPATKSEALHRTSRPRVSGRPPRRTRGMSYQVDPRGPTCVGGR